MDKKIKEIAIIDEKDFAKQIADTCVDTIMPLVEFMIRTRLEQIFEVIAPQIKGKIK